MKQRMEEAELRAAGMNEFETKIQTELEKDNLMKSGGKYRVEISPNELIINGNKQSDAMHKKYLGIYEGSTGRTLSGKGKVTIENN